MSREGSAGLFRWELDGHAVSQTVSVENDISLDVLGFISGVNERPIEKTRGWDTHRAATLRRGNRSRCASQRPRNEGREARWYRWCCSWSRSVKPRLLERQRPATWRQARKSWCSCGKRVSQIRSLLVGCQLGRRRSCEIRGEGSVGQYIVRGRWEVISGVGSGEALTSAMAGALLFPTYPQDGDRQRPQRASRWSYFDVGVDGMEIVTIVATVALNRLGHDSSRAWLYSAGLDEQGWWLSAVVGRCGVRFLLGGDVKVAG